MNIRSFLFLILLKTILIIIGYFCLMLLFFLYFGSGAGASSENAMRTENISLAVLLFLPFLSGIYQYVRLLKIEKRNANSHLFSGILVTLLSAVLAQLFLCS